jgi:VanZ family protein
VITIAFAISDEYHQTFVPGRDGNIRDVLIDSAGAGLACGIIAIRRRLCR